MVVWRIILDFGGYDCKLRFYRYYYCATLNCIGVEALFSAPALFLQRT